MPVAFLAAFVPLTDIAELVNIGTLFAFFIVNAAVIWLRRTRPGMERAFRVPLAPVVPLIGAAVCVYLITKLPAETWRRCIAWLGLGAVIYALHGHRNSRLRRGGGGDGGRGRGRFDRPSGAPSAPAPGRTA